MLQTTTVAPPPREATHRDVPGRPSGRMWFVVDGCGFICFMIAYSLLSLSNMVVWRLGRWPYGDAGARACLSLYEMWFVLGLWSHLACMLSDPGAVPLDMEMEEGMKQCNKCKAPKPLRAHHCSICERCIMKMDHHCPWVNNCVGARNQKHFVLFLLYVQLQCWAAVCSLGAYFVNSNTITPHGRSRGFLAKTPAEREAYREEARRRAATRAAQDWDMLCCILTFFIAIIFGLFTCIMLCDQVSNIIYNQTGIEGLQGYQSKTRPWRESLQEVMGRGPSWRWLVPIAIRRAQVKDET